MRLIDHYLTITDLSQVNVDRKSPYPLGTWKGERGDMIYLNCEEQIKMLEALKTRPVQPDENCPELTDEELLQFSRIANERQSERKKQTVTLRLSPQALNKAKSLGKGYTTVLSRILENALADNETIQHHL